MQKPIIAFAALAIAAPLSAQTGGDMMDLSEVVAAAESSSSAHAMEAELEGYKGQLAYEVELVGDGKITTMYVDARTGATLGTEEPRLENAWRDIFDREMKMFADLNQPLAPRIAAVEQETEGKVREVSYDVEGGIPVLEMEVDTPTGTAEWKVDARDGSRLPAGFDD